MPGRKQVGDGWSDASRRLAELIRAERRAQHLTQEGVARAACLATSTVRKIESNSIQEPSVFTVLALLRVLGLPLSAVEELASGASTDGAAS